MARVCHNIVNLLRMHTWLLWGLWALIQNSWLTKVYDVYKQAVEGLCPVTVLPGLPPLWHSTQSRCECVLPCPSLDVYFGSIYLGPCPIFMCLSTYIHIFPTNDLLDKLRWYQCKAWHCTSDLGGDWNQFKDNGCTLSCSGAFRTGSSCFARAA